MKTIAAIATPHGIGGIGVIRLSGPWSKEVLKKVWKSSAISVDNFATHRLYYGNFIDPQSGERIDLGLAVWMKAPHSYTGEDVVELQGHGSPLLLEKILNSCLDAGAHLAEPGEFTKRAYLNGKLDLAQAEAVSDIISASSEMALIQAREHLSGSLSKKIEGYQSELVKLRAFVEASIDFPEEDIELIQKEGILKRLQPIQIGLQELLNTYEEGKIYREGLSVALVGRPNVGKSSLLNALVGKERAIVHAQPGTTRDVIEELCQFGGISFRLSDTAGLRITSNEVEAIGVSKSRELLTQADLILSIFDLSEPLLAEDIDFLSLLNLSKTIFCLNKMDLKPAWDFETLVIPQYKENIVILSAIQGTGIEKLRDFMVVFAKKGQKTENSGVRIAKLRHKEAVESALSELQGANRALNEASPVEFVAFHLKKSHEYLGAITGADIGEDLLNKIFSEFCIGK